MKIVKSLIIFSLILLLCGCSLNDKKTNTNTTNNNNNNPTDYSSLSLSYSSDINKSERIIDELLDSFMETKENKRNSKSRKRVNDINDIDIYGIIDTNGFTFTGDFHHQSYYGSINDAAIKTSAEPLSYAFGLLESFIQQGKALEEYSGNFYFYPNSNGSIRITCFSELEDIIAVDYYSYHMVIGTSDDNSFVLSYSFDDDGNNLYVSFHTPDYSILYLNSKAGFYGEIDSLIQLFDLLEGYSGLPLYIMKKLNTLDDKIIPLSPKYDSNNEKHLRLMDDSKRGYLSRNMLQEIYFALKYYQFTQENVIEEDTLMYIRGYNVLFNVVIPDGIKTIKSLKPHDENGNEINDEDRYNNFYYVIYIPSSLEKIEEDALNESVKTDYVFTTHKLM